jgi:ABC-type branched-subunit amino acid transport system substrate-binding protein
MPAGGHSVAKGSRATATAIPKGRSLSKPGKPYHYPWKTIFCQVCGKAAEGVINIGMYSTTLDNPENQRFVAAIRAKLQSEPVIFHTTPWIAGQLIVKAVDDLKGELDDPDRVVKALKAAGEGLRTPVGEVRFDAYNQIVPPLYIPQVRVVDGKRKNVVIDRLPPAAQADFWKWWRK